jgi:hypothetical protein
MLDIRRQGFVTQEDLLLFWQWTEGLEHKHKGLEALKIIASKALENFI